MSRPSDPSFHPPAAETPSSRTSLSTDSLRGPVVSLVGGELEDIPTAIRQWTREERDELALAEEETCSTLVRLDGLDAGATLILRGPVTRLGRGRQVDIRLDDDGVSRVHAEIHVDGDTARIVDAGSSNGTVVAGRRVSASELRDGDLISFGPRVSFRFTRMDRRHAEAIQQLYESSIRDPLTQTFNRAHLDERLRAEVAYASRHRTPLSLLMLDIDHFKAVNDLHGHPAGDAVLRFVAGHIACRLRTEDVLARYGGEEFAVLLRGVSIEGARRAGERLRGVIAASTPSVDGTFIPVTASIGCASLDECPDQRAESLVQLADKRLYLAKASGRNRVMASDRPNPKDVPTRPAKRATGSPLN